MKRQFTFLVSVFFDKERKSLLEIVKDLNKIGPGNNYLNFTNYFQSLMYKKNSGEICNYFDGELMHRIILGDNKKGKHPILEDKIKFAHLMMENNIPIARYIACIRKGFLILKNEKRYDLNQKELVASVLIEWLEEFKTIFIKQTDALGGVGILKFKLGDEVNLATIDIHRDYIIEQGIVQHPELDNINPSCINSLRVMSFRENENVQVPSCFLRAGTGDSFVDNAAAGGVFVNYDLKKNRLGEIAYSHAGSGGKCYTHHPSTLYYFENKTLPYPEKVELIITKAAQLFSDIELIGWDIAYTKDGPIIIEGNSNPSLLMTQIALKGLNKNDFYKKYYSMLKNLIS